MTILIEKLFIPAITPMADFEDMLVGGFCLILLIGSITACIRLIRNKETCTKCVAGLGLSLVGLIFSIVINICRFHYLWVPVSITVISLITGVCGATLAIIGVIEYQKNRDNRKGAKRQTVATILITIFIIGHFCYGLYSGLLNKFISNLEIPMQVQKPASESGIIIFKDLSFKYKIPPEWVEINPDTVNTGTTLALMCNHPRTTFMIIAEKNNPSRAMDLLDLAEIAKMNLKGFSRKVKFSEMKSHTVNSLNGYRFNADAMVNGKPYTYSYWLYTNGEFLYQFITCGDIQHRSLIHKQADMLAGNFSLIDSDKKGFTDGSQAWTRYSSKSYGYSLDLENSKWLKWQNLKYGPLTADTGGIIRNKAYFMVIPYLFSSNEAPSLAALTQALLKTINIYFPNKNISNIKQIRNDKFNGCSFNYASLSHGRAYDYRMKILINKRCAYLIAVWAIQGVKELDSLSRQIFNSFHINTNRPITEQALTNLSTQQKKAQALLNNCLGNFYYNAKQYRESLPYFNQAFELDNTNVSFLANLLDTFAQLGQFKHGLEYIQQLKPNLQKNQLVLCFKAWYLMEGRKFDSAIKVYQKLFSENYRNDDNFINYIRLLSQKERLEEAEDAIKKYTMTNDSLPLRLIQAKILYKKGKHKAAINLLEKQQKMIPFNPEITFSKILNYQALKQYKKAISLCSELIDNNYASAETYCLKGDIECKLKWYKRAKNSFEKALKYSPDNPKIKNYLQYISALLGEGNNSAITAEITPVPIPGELKKELPSITAKPNENGYDAYFISLLKGIEFQRGRKYKETIYKQIKVLNPNGVSRFSTLEFDFDPLSEKVYVNKLLVKDGKGNIISKGRISDYYIIDKQNSKMATHNQTLNIPVPGLMPGYIIEYEITTQNLGNTRKFSYFTAPFSNSLPILYSAVYYLGDRNDINYCTSNDLPPQKLTNGLAWIIKNPPVYRIEPLQTSYHDFLPTIKIADARNDWEKLGQNYLKQIKEKLTEIPEINKLALSLVNKSSPRHKKIEIMAKYVQENITYKPLEFGTRALIPDSAPLILKNKYGDCKDHSVLLYHLLKAVSVPSYLTLINSIDRIHPQLPEMAQFNHMILCVNDNGKYYFIDSTMKDLDTLSSSGFLENKKALILNPDKITLTELPPVARKNNKILCQTEIGILNKKDLRITQTITISGLSAGMLRGQLKKLNSDEYTDWAQRFINSYENNSGIYSCEIENLHNNSKPLSLKLIYDLKDRCVKADNLLVIKTPLLWERCYLQIPPIKNRKNPFRIKYPLNLTATVTVRLPVGLVFNDVKRYREKDNSAFGNWQTTVSSNNLTTRIIRFHCQLNPGVFTKDKYDDYQRFLNNALKSVEKELRCHRKSTKQSAKLKH